MIVACTALGLFGLAFALHWAWWRVRVPHRQTAAILLLFFAVLGAGLAWLNSPWRPTWAPHGLWPAMQIAVFHVAMTLAYVVAYSALEERSPSMTLLVHVADAAGQGRSRDDLFAVLSGLTPVETRLNAMVRDGMCVVEGEDYRITPKGRAFAGVFGLWHSVIRLERGG